MVKIIAFLLLALKLFADPIEDVIINIVGEKSFQINQNFINRLFRERTKFILDDEINYYKIIKVLKDNGLLYLGFKSPLEMQIGFKAQTKPIFLTRTINHILSSMGYSYFTISKAKYTKGDMYLTFSLTTEHAVDPEILLSELKKRGIFAKRVARKNQTDWFYELEITKSLIVDAVALKNEDHLDLKNISGEYWFSTSSAGILSILKKNTKIGWSPRIVLYDKDLQILEIITQNEFAASAEVNVTENTAFVMVTDLNNPSRLKSGITITFISFGA